MKIYFLNTLSVAVVASDRRTERVLRVKLTANVGMDYHACGTAWVWSPGWPSVNISLDWFYIENKNKLQLDGFVTKNQVGLGREKKMKLLVGRERVNESRRNGVNIYFMCKSDSEMHSLKLMKNKLNFSTKLDFNK